MKEKIETFKFRFKYSGIYNKKAPTLSSNLQQNIVKENKYCSVQFKERQYLLGRKSIGPQRSWILYWRCEREGRFSTIWRYGVGTWTVHCPNIAPLRTRDGARVAWVTIPGKPCPTIPRNVVTKMPESQSKLSILPLPLIKSWISVQ